MRINILLICILSGLLMLTPLKTYGLIQDMPEPQATDSPGPPPPGLILPIDFGIPALMFGGLCIGVYFLRTRRLA